MAFVRSRVGVVFAAAWSGHLGCGERLVQTGLGHLLDVPTTCRQDDRRHCRTDCTITALVSVSAGSLYSGPLHSWRHPHECDLQWHLLRKPVDAFSLLVGQDWVLKRPLRPAYLQRLVHDADAESSSRVCTFKQGVLCSPVFDSPLSPQSTTLFDLAGRPWSLADALAAAGSDAGSDSGGVTTHAWGSADARVLCLGVPEVVEALVRRGVWFELVALARWLSGRLLRSDRIATLATAFSSKWAYPRLWFPDWPPREWMRQCALHHEPEEAEEPPLDASHLFRLELLLRRWSGTILSAVEDDEERGGEEVALVDVVRTLQHRRAMLTPGRNTSGAMFTAANLFELWIAQRCRRVGPTASGALARKLLSSSCLASALARERP